MGRSVIGVVALVLGVAPAVAQDKPEDVVKKAIAAHGGLAVLKKFPAGTSKIAGKVVLDGREMPFTGALAFSSPGKVRLEMVVEVAGQKASLIQVVNGDKVRQTENGLPSKLDPAMQAELRESAVIQEMSLLYPLLDATRYTLLLEKDAAVDGKDAAVVLVKAKGLKDARLFFEKKTGLLLAMQRKGLNPSQKVVDEITTFADYKTIDGMVVPMKSKVLHDGKPFLEIAVAEYKPRDRVDDKLFATE
jgi:hypothetical protein